KLFARGQWQLAAEVAERVREPGAGLVLQRRLARNMAAMAEHQPLACQAITQSVDACQYQLVKVEDGRFAVVQQPPQGTALRFGPALLELPESALVPLHEALEKHEAGCGVAICGMGDGALARHLVKHHWMFWGKFRVEPMVYVIEPDAGLVLHHFMVEDFSQKDGPIRRGNCRWLVGERWGNDLLELLKQQPTLRHPKLKIPQGRLGKALFGKLDESTEHLVQQLETKRDEIWKRYPVLELRELADLLGDAPPRQPRVMFITSRLTTVLQFANLDCQRAFEAMGWATRLLMEPSAYEDTSPAYLLQQIDDFKPDVLFMIDSLRFHASCVFPPQVLHVCWVQDDLPRLINTEAGQSIGERDFVALPAGPWYCKRFDYPAGQCIFLDKLTHVQSKPVKWVQDGDDLVFVTNAGKPAPTLVREIMDEYRQAVPMVRQLIERVTTDMIRLYDRGNHLHSPVQIRQLIQEEQHKQGWAFNQASAMDQLVTILVSRFNNALYRQQVVRWLMDIASRHHLKLSLYGSGWSENPEFAAHARGTVAYGADLEELTRRSKINMQVVPFGCMHQRLLMVWSLVDFFSCVNIRGIGSCQRSGRWCIRL
ncbi:MAG: hypothetical protein HC898_09890, partial [Phycisphaerales bacterium]|nr:hypothetical protein [Phycisphaerales bacterium]